MPSNNNENSDTTTNDNDNNHNNNNHTNNNDNNNDDVNNDNNDDHNANNTADATTNNSNMICCTPRPVLRGRGPLLSGGARALEHRRDDLHGALRHARPDAGARRTLGRAPLAEADDQLRPL